MSEGTGEISTDGMLFAFSSLVVHLDARGAMDRAKFCDLLVKTAAMVSPELKAEMVRVATLLRERVAPELTLIDGGKPDDEGPSAA